VVSLGKSSTAQVNITGAEQLVATAWPTSGNVDVYVYNNSNLCGSSVGASGQMDSAGCIFSSCDGGSSLLSAIIVNPSASSTAKFVGVVSPFHIN
jgi:hypothetical protein